MRGLSTVAATGDRLGRPWEIMVVEADAAERAALCAALADLHCNVRGAATMAEAVRYLLVPDRVYDAVVTDVVTGVDGEGGGGVPTVGVLSSAAGTPVVVYTEGPDAGVTEWALRTGAAEVVDRRSGPGALITAFARGDRTSGTDLTALPPSSLDLAGTADFAAMVHRVLLDLQGRLPMGLWMFTRIDDDDWIVIDAVGDGYDIRAGSILRWSESFCSRMVRGLGPRVVTDIDAHPVYARAPVAAQIPIGCYVGMPIALEGRGLFGTLCAIDPSPASGDLEDVRWTLEVLARTLSSALAIELERASLERRMVDISEQDSDPLTGLGTRRTWSRLLRLEEARSARTGEHAAIVIIQVQGLDAINGTQGHAVGDATLRRAAQALRGCVTVNELPVRVGGASFGIMAVGRPPADIDDLAADVARALSHSGIEATIGLASRTDGITLADAAMLATDLAARQRARDIDPRTGEEGRAAR